MKILKDNNLRNNLMDFDDDSFDYSVNNLDTLRFDVYNLIKFGVNDKLMKKRFINYIANLNKRIPKYEYGYGTEQHYIGNKLHEFPTTVKIPLTEKERDKIRLKKLLEFKNKIKEFIKSQNRYKKLYIKKNDSNGFFEEVIQFMDDFDLRKLAKNIFEKEDLITEKFTKVLKKKYPNVEIYKKISGLIHIDISIDSKIAIEIKRLNSYNPFEQLFSQLFSDIRMSECTFGIGFGIDMTKGKILVRFSRTQFLDFQNIVFLVKPIPYLN